MFNKNYPTNYTVMSRASLIRQKPDKNTVVLLIHGNIATDLDEPKSFNRVLPKLSGYADYKLLAIDDLNRSELNYHDIKKYKPYFITDDKVLRIDTFLKKFKDKRVIISCVAGISRSGAVGWYLDQIQGCTDKWQYKDYGDGIQRPSSQLLLPHKEMYLKFERLLSHE